MPTEFQAALLDWYRAEARDLPWRLNPDPYPVWISEIMLQQTTVAAILPAWERWMRRFPTVDSLAEAPEQAVLEMWQGLGYYRRARLLHAAAKAVAESGFPDSVEGWQRLPGIGRYTSAAIASISQGILAPLVDGNVVRVFARLHARPEPANRLEPEAWDWTASVMESGDPGAWNQALMELGATVCTPANPRCLFCPVQAWCQALRQGVQAECPGPKEKPAFVTIGHEIAVPLEDGRVALRPAGPDEWWNGLWVLPWTQVEPPERPDLRFTVTRHRISARITVGSDAPDGTQLHPLEALPPMPAPHLRALRIALSRS
ncbi:MAG: A/G-specific adenine glycosylase [Fimbriimonadaceae bacterium]|nr:A/G-specific adenine glycosylase [Fimbriimonadaceae bacterium]